MTREMRERATAAFDALSNWRDEIENANERCLSKVVEQTSSMAQALGWPAPTVKETAGPPERIQGADYADRSEV
jgi:hypothetical protein